jgi:regulatory protein spx
MKWLTENKLDYKEQKIDSFISKEDLLRILILAENGTESIVSRNSNEFKSLDIDLNSLSFNEFLDYVSQRPGILRHPLIVDKDKLQVGFNSEEIRLFMPRDQRKRYKEALKRKKMHSERASKLNPKHMKLETSN